MCDRTERSAGDNRSLFYQLPTTCRVEGLRFAAVIEECDRLAFNPPLKTWEGDKLHRLSQVAEVP
ncbi:MAG: hypothetical protein RID53_27840 [Coleofasciculus sp. B1-GNL1-01]|uniref:hypothetical protein n=1 Tax=Coleofasciculus sp. B1-GNL1-01 TaxID=3068484 RepID=UPI00330453C0